jgi:hypothetical protein
VTAAAAAGPWRTARDLACSTGSRCCRDAARSPREAAAGVDCWGQPVDWQARSEQVYFRQAYSRQAYSRQAVLAAPDLRKKTGGDLSIRRLLSRKDQSISLRLSSMRRSSWHMPRSRGGPSTRGSASRDSCINNSNDRGFTARRRKHTRAPTDVITSALVSPRLITTIDYTRITSQWRATGDRSRLRLLVRRV